MTKFKPFKVESFTEKNVKVDFFKYEAKSIMLVILKGVLPDGSKAQLDCNYIKQQLTINLLAMRPISLLLDLSLLKYSFGNSLIDALSPLFEIQIFEDNIKFFQTMMCENSFLFACTLIFSLCQYIIYSKICQFSYVFLVQDEVIIC